MNVAMRAVEIVEIVETSPAAIAVVAGALLGTSPLLGLFGRLISIANEIFALSTKLRLL